MTLGIVMSVLFTAQTAPLIGTAPRPAVAETDAAYRQMAAGETEEAIAHLERELERRPGDPSLLINLGTAYFRANRLEDARAAFRQAAVSEERYRVELADGSWEDSRKVARLALDSLDRSALAAK